MTRMPSAPVSQPSGWLIFRPTGKLAQEPNIRWPQPSRCGMKILSVIAIGGLTMVLGLGAPVAASRYENCPNHAPLAGCIPDDQDLLLPTRNDDLGDETSSTSDQAPT